MYLFSNVLLVYKFVWLSIKIDWFIELRQVYEKCEENPYQTKYAYTFTFASLLLLDD